MVRGNFCTPLTSPALMSRARPIPPTTPVIDLELVGSQFEHEGQELAQGERAATAVDVGPVAHLAAA
jgi:hypothetical protein